ncbi:heme ABC transporter substrate-binding protein IsdE [Brevibacillus sp. TJ4]|uniref:heme ABC transporter substrate-binding protein IsdE n=1 Tax=Brevibacillus sp. TJ4 TaxID=3234853 RepID=UPI003BA0B4D3
MNKFMPVAMMSLLLFAIMGCSSGASIPALPQPADEPQPQPQAQQQAEYRIVATTVALTEIMDALGVELVGIPTSYKVLPERYDGVPEVGNPMSPDMEKIVSLKATDVLSVTTLEYDLAPKFDSAGVEATFVNLESLPNMQDAIMQLGQKFGQEERAKDIVAQLEEKKTEIAQKIEGKESPTVLILMGVPGSYLVATENSYIGNLVKLAGGTNIVQGEKVEYLASNTEYLQQANPDIILRAAHGMPEEVVKMFDEEFKTNDIWKHFKAVKQNRVYDLEERLFGTTGNLAALEALDEVVKMLYP